MTPASDTRERARAHFEHMFKGLDYSSVGRKELAIDFAAVFASSEAALARKQERLECAKAVCRHCRDGMPRFINTHQGNIYKFACEAYAIHERNLAETGGTT